MNARQFFELVVQMRDAQKSYYRTRSRETLSLSKALESRVDAEIRRVELIVGRTEPPQPPTQQQLFNQ